jgi:hypothetical protein
LSSCLPFESRYAPKEVRPQEVVLTVEQIKGLTMGLNDDDLVVFTLTPIRVELDVEIQTKAKE